MTVIQFDPKLLKVVVRFDGKVPHAAQGVALLEMERTLRKATGMDVRVFKDLMQDDSKLRVKMTDNEREKL